MSMPDSGQPASASTEPKKGSGSGARLIVLLAVLGLAIAALAYDWKVARPQSEEAYNRILAMSEDRNSQVGFELTTNVHVQEMLGKMPAKTEIINGKTVEEYRWQSGFPLRSYKVYVEYDQGDGRLLLNSAHLNELPPPPQRIEPDPANNGEVTDPTMDIGPELGGGPPDGDGRGRGSRPPGRPSPAGGEEDGQAEAGEQPNDDQPAEAADPAEPQPEDDAAASPAGEAQEKPAEANQTDSSEAAATDEEADAPQSDEAESTEPAAP